MITSAELEAFAPDWRSRRNRRLAVALMSLATRATLAETRAIERAAHRLTFSVGYEAPTFRDLFSAISTELAERAQKLIDAEVWRP